MNKNRHRVVFSAARGLRMVVAENARSLGRASTGATAAILITASLLPAQAQIVADPNAPGRQRPTVLSAPNGVPLVNIQTPSAAGVSRNTYRQFDVNGPGAILNNSRTHVQTQLGGWVPGNPWLATGGARVILNEVNSTNPSYLNGPLEVAGQRAEVIIANPAGIQVNGGSFINASGVTLTTGTPVMNEGSLESFRVRGGQVQVNGLGLDARGADHATIFARAMEVNAAIWANQLNVVVGAGQTQTGTLQTTPLSADPNAPKPTVLLDVAAIGGMYAGKIFLRGTEAGLGVNNRGSLLASQGTLTLLPNGQLINSGTVYASGKTTVNTAGDIVNTGVIGAQGDTELQARNVSSTAGSMLASGLGSDGRVGSAGALSVTAQQGITTHGQVLAGGALSLQTPGQLTTDGAQVSGARIDIGAGALSNVAGAIEQSGAGALTISTSGALDNTAGRIVSKGTLFLNAGTVDNGVQAGGVGAASAAGLIASQGDLAIVADEITNGADPLIAATPSTLWSGQTLSLATGRFTNQGDVAANAVVLNAKGTVNNAAGASIGAASLIEISADSVHNQGLVNANEAGGNSNSKSSQVLTRNGKSFPRSCGVARAKPNAARFKRSTPR